MMLITSYLKKKQDEHEQEAKEKGNPFEKKEIHTMIEAAKPISVGRFIPLSLIHILLAAKAFFEVV